MALARLRFLSYLCAFVLCYPPDSTAFDTPLSDTAIREAYFIGQRHDQSVAQFFDRYCKQLPPPKTGPYISTVSVFTPYALVAQFSSEHAYGYSAQQAQLDHKKTVETVKLIVRIQLTDTYGAIMPNPVGQTSGTPWDYVYRPSDFWRDFDIRLISEKKLLSPFTYTGEPDYVCGDGGCSLVGATVQLEFLASDVASDSATVQIDPPEGDSLSVDFDLATVR